MIQYSSFTFNMVEENTYIVWDSSLQCVIIDPGMSTPSEEQRLLTFIQQHNLLPKRCLCTHRHFDHILGLNFVLKQWGLTPEASKIEIEQIPDLTSQLSAFGIPQSMLPEEPPYDIFRTTPEGKIEVGEMLFDILPIPGHSPGHVAFYLASAGLLFSGDALFYLSIGRTDLWGGSSKVLQDSIHTQIYTLPKETTILPGHGPKTTVAYEHTNNSYT